MPIVLRPTPTNMQPSPNAAIGITASTTSECCANSRDRELVRAAVGTGSTEAKTPVS
eukprot:CAMPEP_0172731264 /NCGR_PEP_ID=MMETSP1074-20121228/100789_1 /TAXON_ID=2916 /ORGANISM="Ceratium fusus, Strain PA161109" /LENGTH=56 /DNA_ID=CAMNT_0013559235 /DNA_START=68 /DNA_END=235 /DNA_ORIENTATION=-